MKSGARPRLRQLRTRIIIFFVVLLSLVQGAAFDINTAPGIPLHGLITAGAKNAKTMIWLPTPTGSLLPPRWVEQGSAQAVAFRNSGYYTVDAVKKMQEHVSLSGR